MRNKSSTTEAPSFLQKTYDMLANPNLAQIISWNSDGTEFTLKDIKEFSSQLLPRYFKHCNLASFVRQLNMYDFHKVRLPGCDNTFKHSNFIRDRVDLLKEIKRKSSEPNWAVAPVKNFQKSDMAPIIQKMLELNRKNTATEELIRDLEEKVIELTEQKVVLSAQFWDTQERIKQVEQAIFIIASLMQKSGLEFPSYVSGLVPERKIRSIEDSEKPVKRQKIEQLSIEELLEMPDYVEKKQARDNQGQQEIADENMEDWLDT